MISLIKQTSICFFIFCYFPLTAISAGYCEETPDIIASKELNIAGARLSNDHMKIFNLMIAKNKLDDVKKFFGEINVFRKSPGCASCGVEACYSSTTGDASLTFHRYTAWDFHGFTVKHNENTAEKHCLKNKRITHDMSTASGITLGQKASDILVMFGNPSSIKGLTYEYIYLETRKWYAVDIKNSMVAYFKRWGKTQDCGTFYYDAYGSLTFIFNENKELIEFNVNFMESM